MRKEEVEVLPLAEKHLTDDDWRAIDRAFQANEDPIAKIEERDFAKLFSRIAALAPAPAGAGGPGRRVEAGVELARFELAGRRLARAAVPRAGVFQQSRVRDVGAAGG